MRPIIPIVILVCLALAGCAGSDADDSDAAIAPDSGAVSTTAGDEHHYLATQGQSESFPMTLFVPPMTGRTHSSLRCGSDIVAGDSTRMVGPAGGFVQLGPTSGGGGGGNHPSHAVWILPNPADTIERTFTIGYLAENRMGVKIEASPQVGNNFQAIIMLDARRCSASQLGQTAGIGKPNSLDQVNALVPGVKYLDRKTLIGLLQDTLSPYVIAVP